MKSTGYDRMEALRALMWQENDRTGNSEQIRRLLTNLPLAVEQELTPRQQEILEMRFRQEMGLSEIARELGITKSAVSRSLKRSRERLYRALRYSL